MEFSKCWLNYSPTKIDDKALLRLSVLCDGQIVESAVKEY